MTVTEFIAQGTGLVGLFSEGTIRLNTTDDPNTPYQDRAINSVQLRTDDLAFSDSVTGPMLEAGFRVASVSSDGVTLNVLFTAM